jgi:hypothetical protein
VSGVDLASARRRVVVVTIVSAVVGALAIAWGVAITRIYIPSTGRSLEGWPRLLAYALLAYVAADLVVVTIQTIRLLRTVPTQGRVDPPPRGAGRWRVSVPELDRTLSVALVPLPTPWRHSTDVAVWYSPEINFVIVSAPGHVAVPRWLFGRLRTVS